VTLPAGLGAGRDVDCRLIPSGPAGSYSRRRRPQGRPFGRRWRDRHSPTLDPAAGWGICWRPRGDGRRAGRAPDRRRLARRRRGWGPSSLGAFGAGRTSSGAGGARRSSLGPQDVMRRPAAPTNLTRLRSWCSPRASSSTSSPAWGR